jgi:hypothetical protein
MQIPILFCQGMDPDLAFRLDPDPQKKRMRIRNTGFETAENISLLKLNHLLETVVKGKEVSMIRIC